jgi:PTS system nitrogen regulatory IIA component
MNLADFTRPDLVFVDLPGSDRPTILKAMSDRLAESLDVGDPDTLYQRLWEREELGSTGIGSGVAIPHCKMQDLKDVVVAIGVSHRDVDFSSEDGVPVRLLFLVVSPQNKPADHLRSLAAISKWVKSGSHVEDLLQAEDPEEIYRLVQETG